MQWTVAKGSPGEARQLADSLGVSETTARAPHRPGGELPDCPIVATRPSEYPFPELCGTGVAYKLALALEAPGLDDQLDLVALATIADVVPLVDENRALAITGLAQLKLARR